MNLAFTPAGWEDFTYWADTDHATYRTVRGLLKEILCSPFEGTGKPEPLKYQLGTVWSRRITQEHRLVYAVEGTQIIVLAARFHYGDCVEASARRLHDERAGAGNQNAVD